MVQVRRETSHTHKQTTRTTTPSRGQASCGSVPRQGSTLQLKKQGDGLLFVGVLLFTSFVAPLVGEEVPQKM